MTRRYKRLLSRSCFVQYELLFGFYLLILLKIENRWTSTCETRQLACLLLTILGVIKESRSTHLESNKIGEVYFEESLQASVKLRTFSPTHILNLYAVQRPHIWPLWTSQQNPALLSEAWNPTTMGLQQWDWSRLAHVVLELLFLLLQQLLLSVF